MLILTQSSDNPDDLFDNRSGLFDSASSNFDGDTPANCNAHIEIATSDDNVTYTVTFTNPYKSVNYATGITMENGNTGDYFTVSNKTINGFDVSFFNSSDTAISRTFDYIAKGF